jgi:hypothetical protein
MKIEPISYGIGPKTVRAWEERGGPENPPPWTDPEKLMAWYRLHFGKAPKATVQAAADAMIAAKDAQVNAAREEVAAVAVHDKAVATSARSFLESLGLAGTVARVIEDEDRLYEEYQKALKSGTDVRIRQARKEWMESTEMKRSLHKTQDAVDVAAGVFREWARREWEPRWRELRAILGGRRTGLRARDELGNAADENQWVMRWEKVIEAAIAEWEGEA